MSFLETPRFPEDISYKSKCGPGYNTTIIRMASGHESRNINWIMPLYTADVAYGVKSPDQMYNLVNFFHAVAGKAYGFRFKDHSDYNSSATGRGTVTYTDQLIGIGDTTETDFQLIKTYTAGALPRVRNIFKPVVDTVVVSLNDVEQLSGWSVDTTTGMVTFSSPPGAGVTVSLGLWFFLFV